jgi:serine phosphatase RsbU (regulator of sigma subunit)
MLLIYTDGIPDATDGQNSSFGLDGVVRTVGRLNGSSAQIICDELIKSAVEHHAGVPQHDDMTAVVLRAI